MCLTRGAPGQKRNVNRRGCALRRKNTEIRRAGHAGQAVDYNELKTDKNEKLI